MYYKDSFSQSNETITMIINGINLNVVKILEDKLQGRLSRRIILVEESQSCDLDVSSILLDDTTI